MRPRRPHTSARALRRAETGDYCERPQVQAQPLGHYVGSERASGVYQVTQLLLPEGKAFQHRIKNVKEFCGGFQMLGQSIIDEEGMGNPAGRGWPASSQRRHRHETRKSCWARHWPSLRNKN